MPIPNVPGFYSFAPQPMAPWQVVWVKTDEGKSQPSVYFFGWEDSYYADELEEECPEALWGRRLLPGPAEEADDAPSK